MYLISYPNWTAYNVLQIHKNTFVWLLQSELTLKLFGDPNIEEFKDKNKGIHGEERNSHK